jgi:hypothetical protein
VKRRYGEKIEPNGAEMKRRGSWSQTSRTEGTMKNKEENS